MCALLAVLPWKIAFRVQFQSEKFGLRFHPAQFPDTGNGIYTIRLLELTKVSTYPMSCKPRNQVLTSCLWKFVIGTGWERPSAALQRIPEARDGAPVRPSK